MKVGRVIGAADERAGGDVQESFGAGDAAVVIELRRRDVFDDGKVFWRGAKILTHR